MAIYSRRCHQSLTPTLGLSRTSPPPGGTIWNCLLIGELSPDTWDARPHPGCHLHSNMRIFWVDKKYSFPDLYHASCWGHDKAWKGWLLSWILEGPSARGLSGMNASGPAKCLSVENNQNFKCHLNWKAIQPRTKYFWAVEFRSKFWGDELWVWKALIPVRFLFPITESPLSHSLSFHLSISQLPISFTRQCQLLQRLLIQRWYLIITFKRGFQTNEA